MAERIHILLVDDDQEILELLRSYLEGQGFRISTSSNADEARQAVADRTPDLIVLDLMLPGESGLDFCRSLRQSSDIPIIMLTALGETVDRIVGLEIGADDYLAKPFDPRELVSRIRAVLRRLSSSQAPEQLAVRTYRFESWCLDTVSRTLTDNQGNRKALSGAEYGLLELLVENAGRVMSRDWLSKKLRGREHDPFERSIDIKISRLRQIVGDNARSPDIIKTVYGQGYVIGVPVDADT